jgi:TrmH RNA methyltransferase
MNKVLPKKISEINVCGWQAVSALFAQHPDEIRRLFFDPATGKRTGEMCRYLAEKKKIYRQVPGDELEKVAGTVHHGGIVAVIMERPLGKVTRETLEQWARDRAPLMLLDRVSNANNLGAIVRSAAFFGVRDIVVPNHSSQALPGDAVWRIAEGGMEHVRFHLVPALPEFCAELKRHFFVIGTSVGGNQLSPAEVRARGMPRPPAVILGNEEKGLAPGLAAVCDRLVRIPGADTVESLNVSAAAAILCWEFFSRRG